MQFFCNLFSFIVVVVILMGVVFVVVVVVVIVVVVVVVIVVVNVVHVVNVDIKPMGACCCKISRWMVMDKNGENGWITPIPIIYDLVN